MTPTGVMIQTAPTIHIQVPKPGIVKNHLIDLLLMNHSVDLAVIPVQLQPSAH